jgi:hypothetical protein
LAAGYRHPPADLASEDFVARPVRPGVTGHIISPWFTPPHNPRSSRYAELPEAIVPKPNYDNEDSKY